MKKPVCDLDHSGIQVISKSFSGTCTVFLAKAIPAVDRSCRESRREADINKEITQAEVSFPSFETVDQDRQEPEGNVGKPEPADIRTESKLRGLSVQRAQDLTEL